MAFHTRNAYYLRVSSNNVLPLYVSDSMDDQQNATLMAHAQLYLDERHLEWMSDKVLQHVLADIRPVWEIQLMKECLLLILSQDHP